ncbi:MAG TPA: Holliday junction resolvase RuvX [Terriglobia bacterium]|nr:Holliday junction resolvase RuvX [Terriglobia bacterium]
MEGRILAIDFGMKRFGLAVSDALGLTAQGLPTLERTNLNRDLSALETLIREYEVQEIILGNPLSKDGSASPMSGRVDEFAQKLGKRTGRAVKLWDERLTSAEAQRMLHASGIGLSKRQRAVDRVAATLILQSYLDWRAHCSRLPESV